jgi:endonuclease/exonuclease/phosphatase family metal-dependent hydrolase
MLWVLEVWNKGFDILHVMKINRNINVMSRLDDGEEPVRVRSRNTKKGENMYQRSLIAVAAILFASQGMAYTYQTQGTMAVITSNVAGLPEGLSSSHPATNTAPLGVMLGAYDLVNVQEDFHYDATLASNMNLPYRTTFSGDAGVGDGMNTFSQYVLADTQRVKWNKSYGVLNDGSDQLTPKGLSYVRVMLAGGALVDVYNLHADADVDAGSMAARADNLTQLASYIVANSAGNAVIVMGDTNARYTREGTVLTQQLLTNAGMTDAWISLIRGGSIPVEGAAALMDTSAGLTSANNEVVDKIFYRSSRAVKLTPSNYTLESKFVDASGVQLSDHYPLSLVVSYGLASDVKFSSTSGGTGGTGFNDMATVPENVDLSSVTVRGSARIDAVALAYGNGLTTYHGGTGGSDRTLSLSSGEYLKSATVCAAVKTTLRVFYMSVTSSLGRTVSNGTASGTCQTITAPTGWKIGGFYGRAGDALDQLGAVLRPVN